MKQKKARLHYYKYRMQVGKCLLCQLFSKNYAES